MTEKKFNTMSFIEHLEELRRRIIISLVVLVIAAGASYAVEPYVMSFLIQSIFDGLSNSLALLAPVEGFTVKLKFVTGYLLAVLGVCESRDVPSRKAFSVTDCYLVDVVVSGGSGVCISCFTDSHTVLSVVCHRWYSEFLVIDQVCGLYGTVDYCIWIGV